jgi:hypothetical protein
MLVRCEDHHNIVASLLIALPPRLFAVVDLRANTFFTIEIPDPSFPPEVPNSKNHGRKRLKTWSQTPPKQSPATPSAITRLQARHSRGFWKRYAVPQRVYGAYPPANFLVCVVHMCSVRIVCCTLLVERMVVHAWAIVYAWAIVHAWATAYAWAIVHAWAIV